MKIVYWVVGSIAVIILVLLVLSTVKLERAKGAARDELAAMKIKRLSPLGNVKSLSILPLSDFYAEGKDLKTEPGVSYLIRADGKTILMDVGYNRKAEHPSPLLHNMEKLGVKPSRIDMIFLSHIHPDHVGGMGEMRARRFSLSQGNVAIGKIPVYSPEEISPSAFNPGALVQVIKEPKALAKGVASIGIIPRALYLMGLTREQSLAINLEGKGIVLIIGCGHQTTERIIERARLLFDEPIYAVVGGLHFPVHGGRAMAGPAIEALKKANPTIIALSPHDSSDWSLEQFKKAFGKAFLDLRVGKEIRL